VLNSKPGTEKIDNVHELAASKNDLINAKTAHVLGNPVKHSLSPLLHNWAYKYLSLPYQYSALELDVVGVKAITLELKSTEIFGLSITMPYKELVIELADEVTGMVKRTESANTLVFRDNTLYAENTDVYGIVKSIGDTSASLGDSWGVIGTGATARSAICALQDLDVANITVIGRSKDKLEHLSRKYQINASHIDSSKVPQNLISTLPSFAQRELTHLVESVSFLFDTTYDNWPSHFAQIVGNNRGTALRGTHMLVHQAVQQIEIMVGQKIPAEILFDALPK
jgi:shikimate dehydrogenase